VAISTTSRVTLCFVIATIAIVAATPMVRHWRGATRLVVDSYREVNYEATASLTEKRHGVGQVFTPSVSAYLTSSQFYLGKDGSPTGTIVSKLYAVTGSAGSTAKPTGSPLATSAPVDVSTLPTPWTRSALVTFDFSVDRYPMSGGVPYAIVVEYSGGSPKNAITVGKDKSSPTHPGNKIDFEAGIWIAEPEVDTIFYAYGEVVGNGR
jgi:hypothetical protein